MKKKPIDILNYSILTLILLSTVGLFFLVRDRREMQMGVGLLMCSLYVTWGMIHHAMRGDLHAKVVVEYLLVGAIAMTLISTVVWM